MIRQLRTGLVLACAVTCLASAPVAAEPADRASALDAVQRLFYNGQYAEAASLSQTVQAADDDLALYELRTTAILFQVRRAIGEPADKEKAFKACAVCPALLDGFGREFEAGRAAAQAVLKEDPKNATALFFLGKLDLNYVWLYLGTMGRRTGWNEYWEARHSLDAALREEPDHVRARVARAWIDYIVDTRMPWGTGWLLGGGSKKRALAVMNDAVERRDDFYVHAEALFGLWDMQVREKNDRAALTSARRLLELFPDNPEVVRFVTARSR